MMDEKRPRDNSTASAEPERSVDAVVDDVQSNQRLGENSDARIVAFRVVLCRGDSRLRLAAPLIGGGELVIEQRTTADTIEAFRALSPLPIKDLANPGVALVVRSSLERLVKAAGEAMAQFEGYELHHEREAAQVRRNGEAQGLLAAEIRAIEERRAKAERNRGFAALLRSALEPFAEVGRG